MMNAADWELCKRNEGCFKKASAFIIELAQNLNSFATLSFSRIPKGNKLMIA